MAHDGSHSLGSVLSNCSLLLNYAQSSLLTWVQLLFTSGSSSMQLHCTEYHSGFFFILTWLEHPSSPEPWLWPRYRFPLSSHFLPTLPQFLLRFDIEPAHLYLPRAVMYFTMRCLLHLLMRANTSFVLFNTVFLTPTSLIVTQEAFKKWLTNNKKLKRGFRRCYVSWQGRGAIGSPTQLLIKPTNHNNDWPIKTVPIVQ